MNINNKKGLSLEEVIKSRNKYGSNKLTVKKKHTIFGMIIESLNDPIIKILLIALCVKILFLFKDSNIYDNTMDDFATLDNKLAASQSDIGESSNLAQLAQTYDCTFNEQIYKDYICILSVLAQIAIDSAKRLFDVNVASEIRRIKKDMNVDKNKYPAFWKIIRRDFKENNINYDLVCPMNYLYNLKLDQFRSNQSTIPIEYFFKKFELEKNRKTCKKVEEIIEMYINKFSSMHMSDNDDLYFLLKMDFDNMINSTRQIYISKDYLGLFSWLIDRAFHLVTNVDNKHIKTRARTEKNKAILLKTLYTINRANLLKIFEKNVKN